MLVPGMISLLEIGCKGTGLDLHIPFPTSPRAPGGDGELVAGLSVDRVSSTCEHPPRLRPKGRALVREGVCWTAG